MFRKVALGILIPVTVASLAANGLLYQRYSSQRPLMRMGDEKVTRKEYQDLLDALYGKQVLNSIAYRKLIRQAALKAGVAPKDVDVDARMRVVQQRNPAAYEKAKADPVQFAQMKEDAWSEVALENLRIRNVKVSEPEIEAFYKRNRALFASPLQLETSIVVTKQKADADAAADMLRQNIAMGVIARQPRLYVVGETWQPRWYSIPPASRKQLTDAVRAIPTGQVRVIPLSDLFFVVRVNKRDAMAVQSLAQAHAGAERLARLSKAPSSQETVARLFKEAHVEFDVPRYSSYFDDVRRYADEMGKPNPGSGKQVASSSPR